MVKKVFAVKQHFFIGLLLVFLVAILSINVASADSETLAVTPGSTAEELANELIGEGIVMSNPQLHAGIPGAVGIFTGGSDVVGFSDGIILSTGLADEVVGIYTDDRSTETGGGTDSDLDGLSSYFSNDACYLTFDIIPSEDAISFQYVLSSEEYEEYINYADIFGLFYAEVDSEGNIIGSYQNMAWIPDTDPQQPVSIGTINQTVNTEYYISNCEGAAAGTIASAMDGFTSTMTVNQNLIAGTKYRIKLAIGDVTDTSLDSNAFIKANSVSGQAAEYGELEPKSKADNGATIDVVIFRGNGSDGTVTCEWQALDEADGVLTSGAITFNDGETSKVVTVPANSFKIKLLNPGGGVSIRIPEMLLADLPLTNPTEEPSLTTLKLDESPKVGDQGLLSKLFIIAIGSLFTIVYLIIPKSVKSE